MGKILLVTGGARSGKSDFAEKLAKELGGAVLYIATAIPFDDEMKIRIKKHRESRPKEWETYEGYKNLGETIKSKGHNVRGILVDCVTIMVTNLLFDYIGLDNPSPTNDDFEKAEINIKKEIGLFVEALKASNADAIVVTNELGMGIVPENKLSRAYRDIAGRINRLIASHSDEVYLVVCGIPVKIK